MISNSDDEILEDSAICDLSIFFFFVCAINSCNYEALRCRVKIKFDRFFALRMTDTKFQVKRNRIRIENIEKREIFQWL